MPNRVAERVADGIAEAGWSCVDGAWPERGIRDLAARLRERDARGELRRAGVGAARHARDDVRGDRTAWLERDDAHERMLLDWLHALRATLATSLRLPLRGLEAHYALYPAGAFYARHLDRLAADDRRLLSVVLYLNDDWRGEDGGALRLHLADGPRDLAPRGGRLVVFRSDSIPHEVLPATRERLSVAAWMRRDEVA